MSEAQPSWQLHLGCGIDGMAALADGSVDHVITDPPYDQQTHEGALDAANIDFAHLSDMAHVPVMLRVAVRWVISFCALEQLGEYKTAAPDSWIRSGSWVRTNGSPQKSGDRPAQGSEGIFIAHSAGRKRWNGGGKAATWIGPVADRPRFHPTEKPTWLMEAMILDFTDPGDLICDPYAGSGTTGVAAIRLGRRFVGWERDPKYHAIATKRLEAAREQLHIFPAKTPQMKQALLLKC